MVKVDLITGFLGSGKNDFHKEICCMADESGQNIGILENDFGAVNVDMMLFMIWKVRTASWKWFQVDVMRTATEDVSRPS